MNAKTDENPEPLPVEGITWTALLAQWVDFAKSAVALTKDAEGDRWRASVSDIIGLQAVWFALQNFEDLRQDERALGRDRAGVLIERHTERLRTIWADNPMPDNLLALIDDAHTALRNISGPTPPDKP